MISVYNVQHKTGIHHDATQLTLRMTRKYAFSELHRSLYDINYPFQSLSKLKWLLTYFVY